MPAVLLCCVSVQHTACSDYTSSMSSNAKRLTSKVVLVLATAQAQLVQMLEKSTRAGKFLSQYWLHR